MKKYVNGEYIEMTQEEIDELMENEQQSTIQQPTIEERLEVIEKITDKIKSFLKL